MVVAESISRIARNTKDLLDIVERLEYKGVDFISKKEAIDTKTPSGKFPLAHPKKRKATLMAQENSGRNPCR